MKKTLVFILACLFSTTMLAQETHWTANNTGAGPLPMTMTCEVYFEGVAQANMNLELGAFAGDICRGVKYPPRTLPNAHVVFQLGCYGAEGETITFKLFDHSTNTELAMECEQNGYPYTENGTEGNVRNPYVLNFIPSSSTITAQRAITGFGEGNTTGNYYLISTPIDDIDPTTIPDMLSTNYDLYWFNDAATAEEWQNYKATSDGFHLNCGKGYLYAHETNITLTFTGTPYTGDGTVNLTKADGTPFSGWNLVGNPFNSVANLGTRPFYKMNGLGTEIEPATTGEDILVMEGVFVEAASNTDVVTFAPGSSSKGSEIALNIIKNNNVVDRAIVSFGENRSLTKMQLNPNHTKVYIPKDNRDYAVVSAEAQGEMPVNFKAENNGTYTFSYNSENTQFNYLHLIDNMTGNDIDLLATPSYSFEATTSDYASRFRLVFATSNNNDNNFAFIGNGEIILNGINGNTNVKVFDVTGRMISNTNGANRISTENMAAGVYMIQLVNGENDVKTQKIVVK
jgi:hypothetical protein